MIRIAICDDEEAICSMLEEDIRIACARTDVKATPHKEHLTILHVICLHIFRHISQKCSCIHKVCTPLFVSSDKKSDCASDAQSLCGVAQSILISK
jgi:hypothetical protein